MSPYVYPFYIMIHPIDGYQEMMWNKKQSFRVSLAILLAWFVAAVLERQQLDFVFNDNNTETLNVFMVLAGTIVAFVLVIISNWCFCTLMDGEGKFSEIWITVSYALLPYVASMYVEVALSKFLIKEEGTFLNYIHAIGQIWSISLLVIALKTIHDYSLKTTLFSIGMTIVGVMIIIFLSILSYSLYQEVYGFIVNIVSEAVFRLNE